jgi:hypothetical protein
MKWHVQNKAIFLVVALTAILTFGNHQAAYAASTLEVLPSGEGVFVIQGTGIENAGAMDFTVLYDTSSLANPRVVQGGLISGALMVVNDKSPGAVRLGIIRVTPIQGSGVIATLTFDRKGSSAGKILSLAVTKFANVNGQTLPVVARISNPAQTSLDTSGSSQKQDAGQPAAAAGGAPAVSPGVILLPGGGFAPEEKKDQTAAAPQAETAPAGDTVAAVKESGASTAGPQGITASLEPQKKKVQQYTSVLERFRRHSKERTAKAFLSFFDLFEANGFRQEPPVALSDGKTTVKVFFVVPASGSTSPDYVLRGAKLVSLKQDAERSNTWVLEAQPEKGEYEASLMVSQGDVILEYPLTLAPKITVNEKSKTVTDEDFSRYLSGKRRDLNSDSKRDYLDDYIFTANFIAARQKK